MSTTSRARQGGLGESTHSRNSRKTLTRSSSIGFSPSGAAIFQVLPVFPILAPFLAGRVIRVPVREDNHPAWAVDRASPLIQTVNISHLWSRLFPARAVAQPLPSVVEPVRWETRFS